jgi:hypothetical protein
MTTIRYKKYRLGWQREDGFLEKHVDEETVFIELAELAVKGWKVKLQDLTHTRMIEAVKA